MRETVVVKIIKLTAVKICKKINIIAILWYKQQYIFSLYFSLTVRCNVYWNI